VSKKRVEKLMKEAEIHAMAKKKYRATTDSKHTLPVAANHLNRNFVADKLNQFWVADITYIYTQEGSLYLSTIMDLYSRKIIGWSMKNRITPDLVIEALNMAIKQRNPSLGFTPALKTGVANITVSVTRYCWVKKVSYVR
jgi:transposase InsO family protein